MVWEPGGLLPLLTSDFSNLLFFLVCVVGGCIPFFIKVAFLDVSFIQFDKNKSIDI